MISDRKLYFEFLTLRTTKHGMNMGALILLVVSFLVFLNYIAVRHNQTFDLTQEKINSLSDQSLKVLGALSGNVSVKVFYKGAEALQDRQAVNQVLNLFEEKTSKLKVEFIDAYVSNMRSQKYLAPLADRDQSSVFVFVEQGEKKIRVEPGSNPMGSFGEEDVTRALIKLTRRGEKRIYFIVGHGERELNSESAQGLKAFKEELESSSYDLEELNLVEKSQVPEDAALVCVLGPKQAYLESEIRVLENYLSKGGELLLALDPGEKHNLSGLARKVGVDFKNNYVILLDPTRGQASATSIGTQFDSKNPITASLPENKTLTLFDMASELEIDPVTSKGLDVSVLVSTAPSSFIMKELKTEVTDTGTQKSFPVFIYSTGSFGGEKENDPSFKAVVVGDSDFLTNRFFLVGSNRDLTMNTVAQLTEQKDLISIRPREQKGDKLYLTGPVHLGMVMAGVSLPVVLLLLSGVLWYRRRGA
tara:strand:- start:619 stop:2043 length:1425 start_codon:yes stop_codon:yes gene_type:complete